MLEKPPGTYGVLGGVANTMSLAVNFIKLKRKITHPEPCRCTFSSDSDRKMVAAQNLGSQNPKALAYITMPLSRATTATTPFH